MSYKIVVARYNESIEWLMSEINQCLIYNKGEKLNVENEIILENIGRESETYLHYIITNYNNLPDVVVFTQAKISDHIAQETDDIKYLLNFKNEALKNDKSTPIVIHSQTNINMCWDKNWNVNNNIFFLQDNYLNNTPITFEDWFKKHINIKYPNPIKIYKNAIFAVKKELILNHPLDYYKELILQVNHHINSTEGHFFERSWYYIFNHIKLSKPINILPKIGITLSFPKNNADFFNNGIKQNALFFYKLLVNIKKYDVYFIVDRTSIECETYLHEMNYNYIVDANILDAGFNIIFSFEFMLPLYNYILLKEKGTKNILYNCGNFYMIDSESCLFSGKEQDFNLYTLYNLFDECWNLPHMENTNHFYLKTLLRCDKIIEVPYIWSPELIDKEENKYKKRSESKSIAIFEPNMSIMKWAFPPILICENAYRDCNITDKIKKVYITNIIDSPEAPKRFNINNFNKLVRCLDLRRDDKLSIEPRYKSLYIMSKYADIVVSHTWENWLNNLYFDIAWMGWPIVHNGKFCKEIGYYYDEFNYEMGGNALKEAILNHDENANEYLLRNRLYMQKYLPTNKALKKQYEDLITSCLASE
jgi:hypothetical protein